jgi:branched-chain amino acid aminotransferase
MEYGVASHGAVLAAAPLVARPTWLLLSPPPPASSIQVLLYCY